MAILIYLLIIAAAGLILAAILKHPRVSSVSVPLSEDSRAAQRVRTRTYFTGVFPFTGKILEKFGLDARIKNKLDAARSRFSTQEFFNLQLILMLVLAIAVTSFLKKFDPVILTVSLVLGYFIPDLWLRKRIRERRHAIVRFLPETVDLLGLCVESGLDFSASVKWVIEKNIIRNPMIEELAFVLEEIKWGKPRVAALKDMAKRLNMPEVSSFVQTLVQAERMGTPVSEAFGILSEDSRSQRFRASERFAMQAPIKILLPLIFCILPVIGIIVGGPIFLQFIQGGVFKGF